MDRLVYYRDGTIEARAARVSAALGGLLYGWGVFTVLRVYNGEAFALDHHLDRLVRHAEKSRIAVSIGPAALKEALEGLIKANGVRQGRARITLLKGEVGSWNLGEERESQLLIFTASDAARARRDISLTISPYRLLSTNPLAGIKRTALIEHFLALDEARSRGFSDAVLLNERGEIVSTTAANIFWAQGDELFTPSLGTGCVAGITRRFVCEIASRWHLHVTEGAFPVQRLLDAREVFLTSTTLGIAQVASFDPKQYSYKEATIMGLIRRRFEELTRGTGERQS